MELGGAVESLSVRDRIDRLPRFAFTRVDHPVAWWQIVLHY